MEIEEEVQLGVFCLHMSSDSEKEIEFLGSYVGNDNNGSKTSSPPVNHQGVAARTRRAKDKMNGIAKIQAGYRCSCCEVDTSKDKDKKYLNKGSSVSKSLVEDESIPVANRSVVEDGKIVDQAIADPGSSLGGDVKFSPTVTRPGWKPSDEIELASAVLDGINSGLEGINTGADVMSANLHNRFWERIRKKMRKKSGEVRSKRQIAVKFRKMRKSYFMNAARQGSVCRSNEGHKEELFGILQQIFGDRKKGLTINGTFLAPLEGEVNGNEDQVAQQRATDNIISQMASPGAEVPRNGISYILCLPSPNEPLVLKHTGQNYTAKALLGKKQSLQFSTRTRSVKQSLRREKQSLHFSTRTRSVKQSLRREKQCLQFSTRTRSVKQSSRREKQSMQFSPMTRSMKRKLQNEIVDAQNSENKQPSLVSPRRKLTYNSEKNLSVLASPKRKSAKRASIAAVISKDSQSSERNKSAKRAFRDEHTIPAEMSKDSPSSQASLKIKVVDETRSQNEIASVSQISKDTTSSQFSLKTKCTRWSSQDEMAFAISVLDAVKSGLLGENLGSDVEWRKQSKLWQEVHRQVHEKTGKEFLIDHLYTKFMRLRMKFLNIVKKLHRRCKIQLSDHDKELLKIFQEILRPKQKTSTALSKKETYKSEASQDLGQPCLQMNDSECSESVPLKLTGNEAREEQHQQMEISTARIEQDGLIDMKDVTDKFKELQEESQAICKEIWQSCEQKFLEMQSQLTEMLERRMQELKGSQSVKSTSLTEMGFFLGESSCDGEDGNSRMHLVMERNINHMSRKLQLMQELCRIEKEELETQYLTSKCKGLMSNVVK